PPPNQEKSTSSMSTSMTLRGGANQSMVPAISRQKSAGSSTERRYISLYSARLLMWAFSAMWGLTGIMRRRPPVDGTSSDGFYTCRFTGLTLLLKRRKLILPSSYQSQGGRTPMAKTAARSQATRLSTKGQLIIPKDVRERHGWTAGVELLVEDRGDSVILRRAVDLPETTVDDLVGCTGYKGPTLSLEEMEDGIARGARECR